MTAPATAPRRVLLLCDAYWNPHGGTEGQIHALVANLPPTWTAELWIAHRSPFLAANPFPCRTRSLRLGSLSRPWTWLRVRRLAREVRRRGFHLVQTFMGDASLVGPLLARWAGVPVLVSRRDLGFWQTPTTVALLRRTGRLVDGYVANAAAVARHVVEVEQVPPGDVVVVHNGHAVDGFDGGRRAGLRAAHGIPDDAVVVVLLANLKPLKRQPDLVAAAARLVGRHPRLHVLLLGGGPQDDVRATARALGVDGRVTIHHAQGGAIDFLHEAAVGVLCSETEGLSNAILEYMACGLPVVATDVGGNPDLVVPDENGALYPPGDVDALAAALDRLLADPARAARLGAASRARFVARFGLPRMVAETVARYDALAVGPTRAPGASALRVAVEPLADLVDAWRALLGPDQFFLSPEWVLAWLRWKGAAIEPYGLVARDADGVVTGLLPLVRRGRRLAIAGAADGADHLDVVAAPGRAPAVADAIVAHLEGPARDAWTRLELRHLAEDGALRHAIRSRRWRLPYREALATVCPYVAARGTWDDYLKRFSAKHRGNLRRQARALREDPAIRLRRVVDPAAAADAIDVVMDLHARRFAARGERSAFAGPAIRAFHRDLAPTLAARGLLSLVIVERAGVAIAAHYGFRAGRKLYHFQGGFEPAHADKSPGTALATILLEEDVFGAGLAEYDFLDGNEGYKATFATGTRRLYDLEVFRPTLASRARLLVHGAVALARRR